tara:strand:+ start:2093 stop:2458 length:366 start_codon:yes stop_codon:yes gene_type:complete
MEWYIPITILPGIGLIISSTSSMMLALNNEITQLEASEKRDVTVIKAKLSQLKRLSISIVFQYVGVLFFLFSGILKSIFKNGDIYLKGLLLMGVFSVSISIILLLIYSVKAVTIRQKHLKL